MFYFRVQRGSIRVQRGSVRVQRSSVRVQLGSVRVHRGVQRGSVRVQRGSVGSALACCLAGPNSSPGSAPQGGFPSERNKQWRKRREASPNGYVWLFCMNVTKECMFEKDKINKKSGNCHQIFMFYFSTYCTSYATVPLKIWPTTI
jgi:hypothetical protein